MSLSPADLERFLAGRRNAVIATNRKDGPPQLTSVWYRWTGDVFHVSTTTTRAKFTNLRRDPRVTLCIGSYDVSQRRRRGPRPSPGGRHLGRFEGDRRTLHRQAVRRAAHGAGTNSTSGPAGYPPRRVAVVGHLGERACAGRMAANGGPSARPMVQKPWIQTYSSIPNLQKRSQAFRCCRLTSRYSA